MQNHLTGRPSFFILSPSRRNRLIGKSAVLKTAAVRLGGSSPSSSAKIHRKRPFKGHFLYLPVFPVPLAVRDEIHSRRDRFVVQERANLRIERKIAPEGRNARRRGGAGRIDIVDHEHRSPPGQFARKPRLEGARHVPPALLPCNVGMRKRVFSCLKRVSLLSSCISNISKLQAARRRVPQSWQGYYATSSAVF